MIDDSEWSQANEKLILSIRDKIIIDALDRGRDVIVDDTNLHPKHEINIRKLVADRDVRIEVIFFDADVETCIKRDAQRTGVAHVGEKVIRKQAADWERWKDTDCTVWNPDFEYILQDDTLPEAIIVDVDGTMAKKSARSPFEWHRVGEDSPVKEVIELVQMAKAAGKIVIVFSGRDAVCRRLTENWLKIYQVPYDYLYMRNEGDMRNDAIVKSEMFDQFVADKFYVSAVIDDRPKVCRMWRARGLFTFQVGDPHKEF